MSKIKRKFAFFSIPEYEKEQDWLEKQHKDGWKLVNATLPGIYKFAACEPEDVVYQLDYNQGGSAHKEEYIKMFADCGWEYIQEYAGYSYFRKSKEQMESEEEIFCDDSSRLAMMERVYKARLLPMLVIFCACLIPQFISNLANERYFLAAFMGSIVLIYIVFFVYSAVHYYRKKNKIDRLE